MKMRISFITLFLFLGFLAVGQKKYKPTIAVLDPYQSNFDTTLLDKIQEYTFRVDYLPEEEKNILDSFSKNEYNIKLMDIAEFHYRKQMDFASSFTLSLYVMLTYMVYGQTENCIVFPSHDKSNGLTDNLKALAKKHDVQWVVNPLLLQSYIQDGQILSKARIQIYNYQKNKIVLDKEYIGNTKNPGLELSCESGTLDCTINNVINSSLHDILLTILGSYQH